MDLLRGFGQYDHYQRQNAYSGHERTVEYGSGFNESHGESRPRDFGALE